MQQIGKYFFNDDFSFTEDDFHGVHLFVDGKHIYQYKENMLYNNAMGRVCGGCGAFIGKLDYLVCENCREKKEKENYLKCEVVDLTEYLYSDKLDQYFEKDSWDCIYDYLSELESYDEIISAKFEDLRIHPCEDYFASTIDIESYFEDAPEDFDINSFAPIEEINMHIGKVNELIKKHSIGYISIMNKRISIPDDEWMDIKKSVIEDLKNI